MVTRRVHGGALECRLRAGSGGDEDGGIVGALTAIFAASIGLVQNDIKRVLAYSTVSQLGYMFLALAWGLCGRCVPRLYARVLQGVAVPGRGLCDPCDERGTGYAEHGGSVASHADDSHNHAHRHIGDRRDTGFAVSFPRMRFCGRRGLQNRALTSGYGHWISHRGLTSFYMFRLMFLTFHGTPG